MKEALELFALMAAALFLVSGIIIFIAVHKTNKKEFLRFGTTFTILGVVLMLPGWDNFYTSGFWRVPTPPPPPPTIAQIQQQQEIQASQKEKEERDQEANSPERLKQLEWEKKWVGYWYGERPHVGLLAAAVWLSKGITLDEYGTNKNKRPHPKRGRCDLWIQKGKTDFECEAKHLWLRLGHVSVEKSLLKIETKTNNAVSDVIKKGLALCFVTPAIHKENFSELKNSHRNLFQSLKERTKDNASWFDALIWIGFPEAHKNLNDAFHYPGLLLVIKEVCG
jgi:hypothetical protein